MVKTKSQIIHFLISQDFFIINSSQNKLIWLFAYQYAIWISRKNDNILRGDVTGFLWYRSIPSYKHMKIWGVRVYIINGRVTIINIYDRSHHGYFMGYAATTGVIIYWNLEHTFVIHINHHAWLDENNYCISIEDKKNTGSLILQQYPEVIFTIRTSSTWFHVNLILHPLHFVIQKLSHMKLSYLLLEI